MIQQLQFSKVRVDIKIQNVLRSAVVVGRKNDAQQPFYDKGIAVDSELNLAFFDVFVNPHLTLAARTSLSSVRLATGNSGRSFPRSIMYL